MPLRRIVFDRAGAMIEHTLDGAPQALHPPGVPVIREPIPYDAWPPWAKALKLLAKPEDRGIGDVAARTIGPENSQAFETWYKKTTGKDCGCTGRHADWNAKYPLPRKPSAAPLQPLQRPDSSPT